MISCFNVLATQNVYLKLNETHVIIIKVSRNEFWDYGVNWIICTYNIKNSVYLWNTLSLRLLQKYGFVSFKSSSVPTTSTMYAAGNEGKVTKSLLFKQMYSLLILKANISLVFSDIWCESACAKRMHNIWQVVSESFVNFHLHYDSCDYNWATSKLFIIIITSHSCQCHHQLSIHEKLSIQVKMLLEKKYKVQAIIMT